jgi:hypothetical protein
VTFWELDQKISTLK